MWAAVYEEGWGGRGIRTKHYKYFTRKPTNEEVIEAFKEKVPRINEEWFKPYNDGLIRIIEVKVEF